MESRKAFSLSRKSWVELESFTYPYISAKICDIYYWSNSLDHPQPEINNLDQEFMGD
jgi:hypothetical protein